MGREKRGREGREGNEPGLQPPPPQNLNVPVHAAMVACDHIANACVVPEMVPMFWVSERGSHHLKLSWMSPFEINGVLTGYVISYRDGITRFCLYKLCPKKTEPRRVTR